MNKNRNKQNIASMKSQLDHSRVVNMAGLFAGKISNFQISFVFSRMPSL